MRKGHYKTVTVPATTNNITKGIINFLNSEGHVAWRVNTQGQWDEKQQCWRRSGSTKGVTDVQCCLAPIGKLFVIEVKNEGDRIRPEQAEYMQDIIKAGGFAYVARTIEGVILYYETFVKPTLNNERITQATGIATH